jgi:hypothetical protein
MICRKMAIVFLTKVRAIPFPLGTRCLKAQKIPFRLKGTMNGNAIRHVTSGTYGNALPDHGVELYLLYLPRIYLLSPG